MENNVSKIRKIESSDELTYLPLGSVFKVIWHKSDRYEEDIEYFCVKYGDKIGWSDGNSDELSILSDGINNYHCDVYLTDDKVLALEHLYQICTDKIEDIQNRSAEKMSDLNYGCILAFTEMIHRIDELLLPEMY